MDMSVNPSGMDSIDYSDFEYQQIYFTLTQEPSGQNATTEALFETEPLDGIGGLDNNEVAELVYLEVNVTIVHNQDTADQDVGSETNFNGVVGANFPAAEGLLPESGGNPQGEVIQTNNTASVFQGGSVDSEDRVFAPFQVNKNPAFDDEANGVGGAGGAQNKTITRPFRDMVGRGPVLDSSDNLSMLCQIDQADEIIETRGKAHIYCVWDVAETSDAGRAFSVPNDD